VHIIVSLRFMVNYRKLFSSCGLETAFEFKTDPLALREHNNRTIITRTLGHLHGHWESFRKDNGRLNWVRLKIPSCGHIGRAVAQCPALDNMPYYLDKSFKNTLTKMQAMKSSIPRRF